MAESIHAAIMRHQRLREHHAQTVSLLLGQARYCPECGRYHRREQFTLSSKERFERNAIVSTDAGYGDDDELADVLWSEIWWTCPKGHLAEKKDQVTKSITNRHYRWQRQVTRWE